MTIKFLQQFSIEIYILKQNKQVKEYTILYIVYSHQ